MFVHGSVWFLYYPRIKYFKNPFADFFFFNIFNQRATEEERLEVCMSYMGKFVMGGCCMDLAETLLLLREKESPKPEPTARVHPGVSQVENYQNYLCGKSQDPNPVQTDLQACDMTQLLL